MTEALITGAVAIIVCMINNSYQRKAAEAKHDETISLISYRLEQLEDKVGKHNNLEGRILELEGEKKVLEEKISVANHRIQDLEKYHMQ